MSNLFAPNANRVSQLDRAITDTLLSGLRSILPQLSFDLSNLPSHWINRRGEEVVDGEQLPPSVFLIYNEIIKACSANDINQAKKLSEVLLRTGIIRTPKITAFDDSHIEPIIWAALRNELDNDEFLRLEIDPPKPEHLDAAKPKVESSLRWLSNNSDFTSELSTLAREIVVFDDQRSTDMGAESASCFSFWGGIFINARRATHQFFVLEALVHEAAHQLLFALSQDENPVLNPPEERYASPLRRDPRPLSGIYHAAFVCGRMYLALKYVRDTEQFSANDAGLLDERIRLRQKLFEDATDTINRVGNLSPLGKELLDDAIRWVSPTRMKAA